MEITLEVIALVEVITLAEVETPEVVEILEVIPAVVAEEAPAHISMEFIIFLFQYYIFCSRVMPTMICPT